MLIALVAFLVWLAFSVGFVVGAWWAVGRRSALVVTFEPVVRREDGPEDAEQDAAEESYLPQVEKNPAA